MAEVGIDRSKLPGVKEGEPGGREGGGPGASPSRLDGRSPTPHGLPLGRQPPPSPWCVAGRGRQPGEAAALGSDFRLLSAREGPEAQRGRAGPGRAEPPERRPRFNSREKRGEGARGNLERQDCEIAQEIQVKLVIEAEEQRRQEEDDEDIAWILQQKELQEEKRRKKPPPDPSRLAASEEGPSLETRDRLSGTPWEPGPKDGGQPPQTRDPWRGPPLIPEGLDLETWESGSETRRRRKEREKRRERKKDGHERPPHPRGPPDVEEEEEEEPHDRARGRPNRSQDKTRGPFLLAVDAEPPRAGRGTRDTKRPRSHERPPRTPPLPSPTDREEEWRSGPGARRKGERGPTPDGRERQADQRYGRSPSPNPDRGGRTEERGRTLPSGIGPGGRMEKGSPGGHGPPPPPTAGGGEARRPWNPGTKPRAGSKEDSRARPRLGASQDPEAYDAEIAWKLQEEELLASQVDRRAAQVAQDEEIARLLMAEEKKAYKKAKEREKKRLDPDWKQDPAESVCGRPREGHDPHRGRSEKPTRAAPSSTKELDPPPGLTNQHNIAKSEPAHKGHPYKQ
ncbi:hepatoma-derived growth factor-related protein 2-like [Pseudonaja textilis]|uniref:hepatoma-derived growth factor-related protein 2-like n=1 Tax=Pseudonaja textilis TaxID=8673 RepID=UPI000EA881EE|nr:hepatoma-derived growth factor-related protein 2-like [Pseudonaja textilis]